MLNEMNVFKEIPGFYKIIPLNVLRNAPGVTFDNVPTQAVPRIDAIDRVIHESGVVIYEGPAMLVWPRGVFHRIRSSDEGSSAIN